VSHEVLEARVVPQAVHTRIYMKWKYRGKSIRKREANIVEFAQLIGKPY